MFSSFPLPLGPFRLLHCVYHLLNLNLYKTLLPFCPYHFVPYFVHTIFSNTILSVYHFVHYHSFCICFSLKFKYMKMSSFFWLLMWIVEVWASTDVVVTVVLCCQCFVILWLWLQLWALEEMQYRIDHSSTLYFQSFTIGCFHLYVFV